MAAALDLRLGAAALLMLYYVWSPYHAAAALRHALNDGAPDDLAAAIDFPSVRDALKEQIRGRLPLRALLRMRWR